MSFISLNFIYVFLPVVLICFYGINRYYPRIQVFYLLGVSFFYCAYVDFDAALLLASSIGFNYVIASLIRSLKRKRTRRTLLWLGVLLNVATLFWYKFTLETSFRNVDASLEQANVFLDVGIPLGISFYTFYQISFLMLCLGPFINFNQSFWCSKGKLLKKNFQSGFPGVEVNSFV